MRYQIYVLLTCLFTSKILYFKHTSCLDHKHKTFFIVALVFVSKISSLLLFCTVAGAEVERVRTDL